MEKRIKEMGVGMVKSGFLVTLLGLTSSFANFSANNPVPSSGAGGSGQGTSTQSVCIKEWDSCLQIGGNYTHVNFKPKGNPSFRGNLGGAQGLYEFRPVDRFYGAAKLAWKEGNTHGSAGKRSMLYIDTQERVGYTFGYDNSDGRFTLYTGLGYRYNGQKLSPNGGPSLQFRYNEIYVPVGFNLDYSFNSWFCWGIDFTWMAQVYPTVLITSLKGARWSLTDKLANFYVDLPFTFSLTKNRRFLLIVKPFYERWLDGRTTAKTDEGIPLDLPGNTYNYWGVDLNFGFCF